MPVKDFLASLPAKHRAKALRAIDLLEEFGPLLRAPHVKAIQGEAYKGLWELRVKLGSDISRIFYFLAVGDTFVLLHGFVKKSQRTPQRELETAKRFMADYRRRMHDG
jgi:phage-related protein